MLQKRDFSDKQREKLANQDKAMPDGSFPIVTRKDLLNAIHAIGRAKNPDAVKQHIKRRARALGLTDLLPDDWKETAKSVAGDFKYFVKITKAYTDDSGAYVEGIASGTLEDRDEQRMNKSVLERFVQAIPMPLTNSHPRAGDVLGDMGTVIDAKVLDDANSSLFIKAKLDMDHPGNEYMLKKIAAGKRHAFSIEGGNPVVKTVYSERLGKNIEEFVDVTPRAISITTEPSYIPSLLEVMMKAHTQQENLNITNTNMDKEVKTVKDLIAKSLAPDAVATTDTTETTNTESAAEPVAEVETETTTDTTTDTVEAPTEEVETETDVTEATTEVTKAKKAKDDKKKEEDGKEDDTEEEEESDEEDAAEDPEEEEDKGKVKKKKVTKKAHDADEQPTIPADHASHFAAIHKTLGELTKAVDAMSTAHGALMDHAVGHTKMLKAIHKAVCAMQDGESKAEEMEKSLKAIALLSKSVHDDMEIIKGLPLQKRSLVAKSSDAVVQDNQPKTFKDILAPLFD